MAAASFETTLLRERFVITDKSGHEEIIIALSNRMVVALKNHKNEVVETFVIRAHTMSLCTMLAAEIARTFEALGPIKSRDPAYKWDKCWASALDLYEEKYNPNAWCAIYTDGKKIFSSNEYHIFLDLIEQFEFRNNGKYEKSLEMAEKALVSAGQNVKIEYDANIALIMKNSGKEGRVGIVLRSPKRKTTFNFTVKEQSADFPLTPSKCLKIAGYYLEGIQLSFVVGGIQERLNQGVVSWRTDEEKQCRDARKKLNSADGAITSFVNTYAVNFRPERPDFKLLIEDAQKQTREYLDETLAEAEENEEESNENKDKK